MLREKTKKAGKAKNAPSPSPAQVRYLSLGLMQPGGKLPLFDRNGQKIKPATIRACLDAGWCERWYENPVRKDWLVCRLTDRGRKAAKKE